MKTMISETIDGSMKDVLQLKTLDRSLEYSQLFDALEDCPNDFKSKLIGALNSLSQTMGISPSETFNKVLCASDDENAKKKMYNWWRAVFEVISKSVPNIPKERRKEYEDKLDALVAEICKAGDKASGNDVVLEEYEPASIEDEGRLKENMNFAISKIGEVAKKVEELVNFLNPYCGTEVNESTMDENEAREFVKAIGFRPDDDGHDYETQLVDALTGKDTSYNAGWGAVYYNSDKVLQFLKKFGMLGSRGIKQKEAISKLRRLFKSGKWKAQETTFENEVKTMKKMTERGGADEWIPANELAGKLYSEQEDEWEEGHTKFKVGDLVSWRDPEYPDELSKGWRVVDVPENDGMYDPDAIYVIVNDETGSEAEVLEDELVPAGVVKESVEPLEAEDFLNCMLEDAEDTDDVFEVYDGGCDEDGYVFLNVRVNKEDTDSEEVEAEFQDAAAKYGWEYSSWAYSSDIQGIENTVGIVVYFKPIGSMLKEGDMENELKKGDDGWREIGEAKATVWCVVLSDGTEKKFKCSKDEAKTKAKELAEKEGLEVKRVYPVLYPRNPYKGIFKETAVIVDANDVWAVLDLLDDETANKNLTDLINSHVRNDDEIMDAIDSFVEKTWGREDAAVTKSELNKMFSIWMSDIVDELGLDVEKFKASGEFVDSEKPVTLEGSEDLQQVNEGWKDIIGLVGGAVLGAAAFGPIGILLGAWSGHGVQEFFHKRAALKNISDQQLFILASLKALGEKGASMKDFIKDSNGKIKESDVQELIRIDAVEVKTFGDNIKLSEEGQKILVKAGYDEKAFQDAAKEEAQEQKLAAEGNDGKKPDEVKGGEKKYKQDGETKTLVTGEKGMSDKDAATIMGGASATDMDAADIGVSSHEVADPYKKPICEMTIEQDIQHAYQLVTLLWGNAKYYLEKLLTTKEFSGEDGDEEVLRAIDDMGITSLSQLNDVLSYEFETLLEALGCDLDAWNNGLEIKRA